MVLSKNQLTPSIQKETVSFQKSASHVAPKLEGNFYFQKSIRAAFTATAPGGSLMMNSTRATSTTSGPWLPCACSMMEKETHPFSITKRHTK
jgi:hypothetical protein